MIHAIVLAFALVAADNAVPLRKGDEAPFGGVLLKDDRFAALLLSEVKAEQMEQREALDARYIERLEKQLDRSTQEPKWYIQPGFQRWLGFGVGVLVTTLAIQMGVIIVDAHDG